MSPADQLEGVRRHTLRDLFVQFRLAWLIPFAAPIAIAGGLLVVLLTAPRPQAPTPDFAPRNVESNESSLRLVSSRVDCIPSAGLESQNALIGAGHTIISPYTNGPPSDVGLRMQDAVDGSLKWQTGSVPYPFSMAVQDGTLFVTSSIEVIAYSLSDGKTLWQKKILPGHTGNVISKDDHLGLTIYYTQDNPITRTVTVLTLDPSTGDKLNEDDFPCHDCGSMAPTSGDRVLWISGDTLWQTAGPDGPTLWRVQTSGKIARWPIEYSGSIFVSSGLQPEIYAIDENTGNILWHDRRQFASLPAIYNRRLHAITKGSTLVSLDPVTGAQDGVIQFSSALHQTGSHTYFYGTVGTSQFLAAYFGDTCQMIVFSR